MKRNIQHSNKNQKPFDIDPSGRWALVVSEKKDAHRTCPLMKTTADAIHFIDLETRAVEEVYRGDFLERCAVVPGGFLALDRDRLMCFEWAPGSAAKEAWAIPRGGLARLTGTGSSIVGLGWKTRRFQSVWASATLEGLRWLARADFEATEHPPAKFPQAPSGGSEGDTVWIRAAGRSGPSRVLVLDNPQTTTGADEFARVALDLRADQLPSLQVDGDGARETPQETSGKVTFAVKTPDLYKWIVCIESGMNHPGRYRADGHERWKWDHIEKEFVMADAFKAVSVKDLQGYLGAENFLGFRKAKDGPLSEKKSAWKWDTRTLVQIDEEDAFAVPALPFNEWGPGVLEARWTTLIAILDPGKVQHRSSGVRDKRDYLWGRVPVSDKDKAKANKMLERKPAHIFPPEDRRGIMLWDRKFTVLPDLDGLEHTSLGIGYQPLIRTEGIAALPDLERLNIEQSNIHYLTAEIGQLTKLRMLSLATTGVRVLPSELSNCKQLEELLLPDRLLDWDVEANLAVLGTLKNLKELRIGKTSAELVPRIQELLPECNIRLY